MTKKFKCACGAVHAVIECTAVQLTWPAVIDICCPDFSMRTRVGFLNPAVMADFKRLYEREFVDLVNEGVPTVDMAYGDWFYHLNAAGEFGNCFI